MRGAKSEELLREHDLSVTRVRVELLDYFLKSQKPLSVYDFKTKKLSQKIDESSFYRNIKRFEEAGIIRSIPTSHGFHTYEMTPKKRHHHHITCTQCKKVECMTECGLEEKMTTIAQKQGFRLKGHSLELFGLCLSCQKKH